MLTLKDARFTIELFVGDKVYIWYSKEEPQIATEENEVLFVSFIDLHSGQKKTIFNGIVVLSEFEFERSVELSN